MVNELLAGQLAARLRRVRLERGLTLRQAAEQTGVTKETLSDLERARRQPHPPTLRRIAQGYSVEIRDLLGPMIEAESVPLGKAPGEAGQAAQEERRAVPITEASAAPFSGSFKLPGLRAARERLGWSHNELAAKANVPAADIPALEDGSLEADGDTVSRLARTLDRYIKDLTEPEVMDAFRARGKEADRLQAERLIRDARNLDKETVEALRNVSPGGRKVADAIDALVEQRASEQPDAG